MMSSSQYPITTPTIISISQDGNLQKKCDDHKNNNNNNRFQHSCRNIEALTHDKSVKNTQHCNNKSKISISYEEKSSISSGSIDHDGEMLKKSLNSVLAFPSLESDGSLSCEKAKNNRHILKIQISPTTLRKTSLSSEISAVDNSCNNNKKSSIIINNSSSRKMSVVSNSGKNEFKNVTIIQNENNSNSDDYEKDEFDGNLSDDQKLVLTCGSKMMMNGKSNRKSEINIVNVTSDGIILNSGQCSPECKSVVSSGGEDHLDSGTCSDVEVNNNNNNNSGDVLAISTTSDSPPPPLPPKGLRKIDNGSMKLSESTCSDASSASSSSTDSMQYHHVDHLISPDLIRSINANKSLTIIKTDNDDDDDDESVANIIGFLPRSLLDDIRTHSIKTFLRSDLDNDEEDEIEYHNDNELNYSDIVICNNQKSDSDRASDSSFNFYDDDKFYKFHINENFSSLESENRVSLAHEESDESFAGYKDIRSTTSTIRSAKGTIRGVKNRVRNGIATFLQMQQTTVKNFKDKDGGKIVLYTTSMGVVRTTYAKCQALKQILRTLMVKFEERDVFMCYNHQQEIRERMQNDDIDVPQLFVDGQYIGNADQVERLNETGELRMMLKPYKCRDSLMTCKMCGGYKMLPCHSCGGSKKSIHRNHFTTEFIALKCMNCDEVGLVKCYNCV